MTYQYGTTDLEFWSEWGENEKIFHLEKSIYLSRMDCYRFGSKPKKDTFTQKNFIGLFNVIVNWSDLEKFMSLKCVHLLLVIF